MARTILAGGHPERKLAWQSHLCSRLQLALYSTALPPESPERSRREGWLSCSNWFLEMCVYSCPLPIPQCHLEYWTLKELLCVHHLPCHVSQHCPCKDRGVLLPKSPSQLLLCVVAAQSVLLWVCSASTYCKVSSSLPSLWPCGTAVLRLWRAPCSQMTAWHSGI